MREFLEEYIKSIIKTLDDEAYNTIDIDNAVGLVMDEDAIWDSFDSDIMNILDQLK